MKRSFVCAAWICMALAGDALADGSGPYVSAALGRAEMRDRSGLGALVVDEDKDDASWTLGLGYRLSRYLALDVGYVDLGEVEAYLATPDRTEYSGRRSVAAEGTTLALVGTLRMGHWEPYVKAGMLFAKTDSRFDGQLLGYSLTHRIERESEDPFFGAGVRYPAKAPLQVYLDVTYFDEVGGNTTGSSSYLNASAGMAWQF